MTDLLVLDMRSQLVHLLVRVAGTTQFIGDMAFQAAQSQLDALMNLRDKRGFVHDELRTISI